MKRKANKGKRKFCQVENGNYLVPMALNFNPASPLSHPTNTHSAPHTSPPTSTPQCGAHTSLYYPISSHFIPHRNHITLTSAWISLNHPTWSPIISRQQPLSCLNKEMCVLRLLHRPHWNTFPPVVVGLEVVGQTISLLTTRISIPPLPLRHGEL